MATTYYLNVNVSPAQVELLQLNKYKLCISKKVNDKYCVVWHGTDFSVSNQFKWTESYRTFASLNFESGALVTASTNQVPIACGQTATVANAVMGQASGPTTGGTFTVVNKWRPCHFGVEQLIDGAYTPTYVDPDATLEGSAKLTPIVSVMAFFSRDLQTSSMFVETTTSSIDVDYLAVGNTQTISYVDTGRNGNGMWVLGDGKTQAYTAVVPMTYSIARGFEPLPASFDAFAIGTLVNEFLSSQKTVTNCPMGAYMVFPYAGAAQNAVNQINQWNQHGWPPAFNMNNITATNPRVIISDNRETLEVVLDTVPGGGLAAPVQAIWTAAWDNHYYPEPTSIDYRWQ